MSASLSPRRRGRRHQLTRALRDADEELIAGLAATAAAARVPLRSVAEERPHAVAVPLLEAELVARLLQRCVERGIAHGIAHDDERSAPCETLRVSMWIFGYGSLIFRPGFDFLERRPAWIAGYVRRFWQGSPDHRGTAASPGRVVTLLPDANVSCGGAAYRIDPTSADETLRALDEREIAGFERTRVPLLDGPNGAAFAEAITWIAPNGNAHFLGELPEVAIAAHVRRSRGPSGANADYVKHLAAALRELGVEDPHVEAIVRAL